jgi:hypothetical protein
MHTALSILSHALRMLIFESATTVRVVTPALIMVLGSAVISIIVVPDAIVALQAAPEDMVVLELSAILLLLVLGIIGLLGYALMAVLWHRHVLLSGSEGIDTPLPDAPIYLRYLGRAIMVGFIQMLASVPIALASALLGGILVPALGGLALLAIGVLAGLAFLWIALRISLVLPAAAMGNPMTIQESWEATAPLSPVIWGIAALLAGLNMCVFGLTSTIFPDQGGIALVVQAVHLDSGLRPSRL